MQSKSLADSVTSAAAHKDMLDRYQRAQHLNQGIYSKCVARNTTLFPIWIGDSDCFWYERELKEGKNFVWSMLEIGLIQRQLITKYWLRLLQMPQVKRSMLRIYQ